MRAHLSDGSPSSTPEQALDCALGPYLTDLTTWIKPPKHERGAAPDGALPLHREAVHLMPAPARPTVWNLLEKNQVEGDLARRIWMNSRIHSGWSGQARAETITPSTTAAPFTN